MNAIIDFNSDLLVDRSRFRDPHLRLLLAALGRELVKGSEWVVVNKEMATYYGLARQFITQQCSGYAP
jgi:hypothetical protein